MVPNSVRNVFDHVNGNEERKDGGVDELNFQGGEGLRGDLEEVTAQASSWAAPLQER